MAPKYRELAPGILYFPEALKDSNEIVEHIETAEPGKLWTDWREWNSEDGTNPFPLGKMRDILRQGEVDELVGVLDSAVVQCVEEYVNYLNISEQIEENAAELAHRAVYVDRGGDYNIKKYDLKRELGPHPDWDEEGSDAVITVAIYFNDDYEGGELSFTGRDASVKPDPGSVCIFPSYFFHESSTMVSGIKYLSTEVLMLKDNSKKSIFNRLMEF